MIDFETKFPVRYYETDQMGIVHHSNYIRYFEVARLEFMKEIGFPIEECERLGVMLPIVSVECRYKVPALLGDVLTVTVCINEVPGAKLVMKQQVFNQKGQLCAEGKVVSGFIDKEKRNVVRCPKVFADLIEERLNDK